MTSRLLFSHFSIFDTQ